jgi:hypothetical protein
MSTRTCLNRFLGICKHCKEDYSEHHPNNEDCPRYRELSLIVFDLEFKKWQRLEVKDGNQKN